MADHLTEEEQIEAIKRWWSDNWLSIVLPVTLLIVSYTGWNYWGDHKAAQAQEASDKYQSLVALMEPSAGGELNDDLKAQISALADEIRTDYSGGMYADLSALIIARLELEAGDLDAAAQTLQAVSDSASNDSVKSVAQSRLARVLISKGQYSEALVLVSDTGSEELKAINAEIRGDIYMAQGEVAAARTAYEDALASLTGNEMSHRGILQFKLDGAQVPEPMVVDELSVAEPEVGVDVVEAINDAAPSGDELSTQE